MENAMEGDASAALADPESRKTHIRPSDDDKTDPVIPNKIMKLTDEGLTNPSEDEAELNALSANEISQEAESTNIPIAEIDSDVDLGDEEDYEEGGVQSVDQKETEGEDDEEQLDLEGDYAGESDQAAGEFDEDFEEGDAYDEDEDELGTTAEETEDNVQEEEADSSTDLHDFVQANLAYIEDCQSEIDDLNRKANEDILLVELKYNKLRLPVYKRRNTYIERVPHFWAMVFAQHRQLRQVLTKEDIRCLKHVTKLQVEDLEDNRSGYSIQFYFSENPWFGNKVITKEYQLPWQGCPSCSCTPIQWKKGMNLTLKSSSFFSWFTSQDDASADDIAEIIKDDLWPNPRQCFPPSSKQPDESDDDEEADDSGNLNIKDDSVVLLDDSQEDDVEYISSEDEEETEWRGEKGRATTAQYLVQEDEGDEPEDDEYEDFDEEELVDVTGTSSVGQQRKVQDRRPKSDVINLDDDYLGSDDEEEGEYFDGTVDLDGEEKLLQGLVENEDDFEEDEPTKEPGESPKPGERLAGGIEIQHADSSHDANEDSRHSNGIVGSSTIEVDDLEHIDTPNELDNVSKVTTKMQEQSKVVSTSTAGDSDVATGAT